MARPRRTPHPGRRERRRERRARRREVRWQRRRRSLLVLVLVLGISSLVLTRLDTPVRTAVGAEGVGRGSFPVAEVAGLGSNGSGFAKLTARLHAEGTPVLDFDADEPGTQPLVYRPEPGVRIPRLATSVVEPALRAALRRGGFDPATQVVDVVAHSTGGLLVRYLVEHPLGRPTAQDWAAQVDDLVMVAVPNHGSDVIAWETGLGGNPMGGLGQDMAPGSPFLDGLGYREPAGEVYTTIGGDPWVLRWVRHGSHGFDDQVPAESPFLAGAANNTYGHLHGRLLRSDDVVDKIVRTLRAG